MKKPINKNSNKMKNPSIDIVAKLVQPRMLRNLVEKLADRGYDIGYSFEKMQPGWQAIDTSSIEAYVSVNTNLSTETDSLSMNFVTCFLFTCIKAKRQDYTLTWVNSLS
ncbi:MAG TPA: hypothetical protein VJ111_16865 [Chitinophagaceae bacterium]|nr:hypothetical protein [Chitinophagaceae bacterium]